MVHAGWNLLLAREEDTHAATAVAVAIGALAFAPVAIADWRMSAEAVPYMTAPASLELIYLGLLATAYSLAELLEPAGHQHRARGVGDGHGQPERLGRQSEDLDLRPHAPARDHTPERRRK